MEGGGAKADWIAITRTRFSAGDSARTTVSSSGSPTNTGRRSSAGPTCSTVARADADADAGGGLLRRVAIAATVARWVGDRGDMGRAADGGAASACGGHAAGRGGAMHGCWGREGE